MQNYKFLNHIVLWNVFFAIICIPTAGKLIDVMGIPLSISIYYFPFVYIFADILPHNIRGAVAISIRAQIAQFVGNVSSQQYGAELWSRIVRAQGRRAINRRGS